MSTLVTDRAAFCRTARPGVRVPIEVRISVEDPFVAYRCARNGDDDSVYLETTGGQDGWGYFAVEPIDRVTVGPEEVDALELLVDRLEEETLLRGACDVPYPCGAFGWLSYDIARELESIPESTADERRLPRLEIGVYDRVAAWRADHEDKAIDLRITACPHVGSDEQPATAYRRGRNRAIELTQAIDTGNPEVESPALGAERSAVQFESDCSRGAFRERVRRVKEHIRNGETFQANVSQRLSAPATVHPVETYAALRRVNPAPYSGLLEFSSCDLVSASPELLLERVGDRLRTEPIAGTRPRGETVEKDRALAAELRSDAKERAEHAMLVDLERNDLGKVSEYGSVTVRDYRRIDRYSAVMHLVSLVEGRLRDECDLADAIAAVFPGGTITGAPKPTTMAIIEEVEATRRGPYTGSIGAFGFDGRATLNIVIRTLVRHNDEYHLRVGAGVVHDSVPDREYDETLTKGRALITAIDDAIDTTHGFTVQ